MTDPKPLFLYEEIMLLALRNEKGTVATGYAEYAVAGAVLAESLLDGRVSVDDTRKHVVTVHNAEPTGDPIIDECLQRLATANRRASLKTWVGRLAKIKKLRHKVARQLCDRGILRADEDKVLFVFSRKTYPEINPVPEKRILDRLQRAIFTDTGQLDPRTVVLISLANGSGLLAANFGKTDVRSRKKRIEQIVTGELTGKATKEVIAACEAAVMVAVIMPVIISR